MLYIYCIIMRGIDLIYFFIIIESKYSPNFQNIIIKIIVKNQSINIYNLTKQIN